LQSDREMAVRDAERSGAVSSVASVDGAATPSIRLPWYRRLAFWRGLAGMALAIALGSAIVTAEFSSQLLRRTTHLRRRLNQLSSKLTTMRGEIANADREIAGMRVTVAIDEDLRRILDAPDARLIRLGPPGQATSRIGVIAFSPALRRAAVEITGLPASAVASVYSLWWTRGTRGAPLLAARFSSGADGKAGLTIALPAGDSTIDGAIVTMDSHTATAQPDGAIILKGTVAPVLTPRPKPNPNSAKPKRKLG
jgi:hypothetical protein